MFIVELYIMCKYNKEVYSFIYNGIIFYSLYIYNTLQCSTV